MSPQLYLGLFIAAVALLVLGGAARTVVMIRQGREQLGTNQAVGPRWPLIALHVAPFVLVLGYLAYANAVGHFDDAGPLMAVACTMLIVQGVVVAVMGLRATVVSFWVTALFVLVEMALATAMLLMTLNS